MGRQYPFADAPPASPLVTREDERRHVSGAVDRRVHDPEGYLWYGQLSEAADDVARGYAVEDGEPIPIDHDLEAEARRPFSAGGILSSVTELAAAVRCLLNGGEHDGTRVLRSETVEAMCQHQAPTWSTIDGTRKGLRLRPPDRRVHGRDHGRPHRDVGGLPGVRWDATRPRPRRHPLHQHVGRAHRRARTWRAGDRGRRGPPGGRPDALAPGEDRSRHRDLRGLPRRSDGDCRGERFRRARRNHLPGRPRLGVPGVPRIDRP